MEEVTNIKHVLSTFITQVLSGVVESVHQQGYQVAFLASKCGETEILSLQGGLTLNIQNALEVNFKQLITDHSPKRQIIEETTGVCEQSGTEITAHQTPSGVDAEYIQNSTPSSEYPNDSNIDRKPDPVLDMREIKLEPAGPEDLTLLLDTRNSLNNVDCSRISAESGESPSLTISSSSLGHQSIVSGSAAETTSKVKKCGYCEFETKYQRCLTQHIRRHTGEKPFTCPYCPYKSATKSNVIRHVGNKHPNKPKQYLIQRQSRPNLHRCKYCEYSNNHRSNLLQHIRRTHTRHQSESDSVNISLLVPTASDNISHVEHVERADFLLSADSRKPYYDSYSSPAGQQSVTADHSATKSSTASKLTINPSKLCQKLQKCMFCDYTSNTKIRMVQHLRTHTGEKPFACTFCPYRSSVESNLRRHIAKQHIAKSKPLL